MVRKRLAIVRLSRALLVRVPDRHGSEGPGLSFGRLLVGGALNDVRSAVYGDRSVRWAVGQQGRQ